MCILVEKKPLHFSKSSPALLSHVKGQFNIINDDTIMIHCFEEMRSANIFVRFLQYTRALKTWEMHHIHLNADDISSESASIVISNNGMKCALFFYSYLLPFYLSFKMFCNCHFISFNLLHSRIVYLK